MLTETQDPAKNISLFTKVSLPTRGLEPEETLCSHPCSPHKPTQAPTQAQEHPLISSSLLPLPNVHPPSETPVSPLLKHWRIEMVFIQPSAGGLRKTVVVEKPIELSQTPKPYSHRISLPEGGSAFPPPLPSPPSPQAFIMDNNKHLDGRSHCLQGTALGGSRKGNFRSL